MQAGSSLQMNIHHHNPYKNAPASQEEQALTQPMAKSALYFSISYNTVPDHTKTICAYKLHTLR